MDGVYRTRSLGAAAEGVKDQYADGKAAKVWELYIGDQNIRTVNYRKFLLDLLRKHSCKTILDVACGTGIDSVLLVEDGFSVTSVDASDKMLKYALKTRWDRRKERGFDDWVIGEANWLCLPGDIKNVSPARTFDALICLGNSFAHLPDNYGDQRDHRRAFENFEKLVKPGGLLLIDHRNYDYILDTGSTPAKNIYYSSTNITDIKTSVLTVDGHETLVTLDYKMDIQNLNKERKYSSGSVSELEDNSFNQFRLSYYPHRLKPFSKLLDDVFGPNSRHTVYGDFKPLNEEPCPAFYIHIMEKSK